jgi:modification methylase
VLNKYLNKIIRADSLEELPKLPDKCVDMIFADPPYNLQLKNALYRPNQTRVNGVNDFWDKFSSFEEYDDFTSNWLIECKRILKNSGSLWVIGSYHNIFRVGKILQDLKFWILNDIVWVKTNPMPNFKGTRFTNAHETLIWCIKDQKAKYTFNYKAMKVFNDDKQMRSDWLLPLCSGKERIKIEGTKAHSTQKPLSLLYRIILASTNPGDVILDPFCGSGTSACAAKHLGRNYIGIDKEEDYCKIAQERLSEVFPIDDEYLLTPAMQKPGKVPFGNIIEAGLLNVGDILYDKKMKIDAKVNADASITCGSFTGSIHKTGSYVSGKRTCNGWDFWHIKNGEMLFPLDILRQEYIKAAFEL